MRRKGQAALEFLTTYGWAILIVLVMIGAISYFGIMNPSKILPSRCTVGTEFTCVDYQIKSIGAAPATVSLLLTQGVGKTIYFQGASCRYGDASVVATSKLNSGDPWSPRDSVEITCEFADLNALVDQKAKVFFEISYAQSVGGFTHIASGELYTEVQ